MGKLRVHNIEAQTGTNVDLGAAGDVVTFASDSIQTNLYKDAGGNTLFQSDGAGTLSNVNSKFKGDGPNLILSQTASSSASISFTSGIDSTYDKYMFVFVNIWPASGGNDFMIIASVNGGSSYGVATTTTAFRGIHGENGSGGALSYRTGRDAAQSTGNINLTMGVGGAADEGVSGIVHLYAPSSTAYVKQFYSRMQIYDQSAQSVDYYVAGYVNSTSAVDAIKFLFGSGNIGAGTIKMYGVT